MAKYKKVAVGGSFDAFHKGHELLLNKAFSIAKKVLIGITSDEIASKKPHKVEPLEYRVSQVEEWIKRNYPDVEYEIYVINDRFGPAANLKDLEAIVVSPETYYVALRLNEHRVTHGLKKLDIIMIGYVLAQDLFPISSTRIRQGEIDREGKRLTPLRIGIGSSNKAKVKPVVSFLRTLFSNIDLEIEAVKVNSEVPEQPFNDETYLGAYNRAKKALEEVNGDYGVGIESGIFEHNIGNKKRYLVYQVACVYDKYGNASFGISKGFELSDWMLERIKSGETLGDIAREISGRADINENEGIVGFLSKNIITRYDLSYDAVKSAFVPRLSPEYYGYKFVSSILPEI